MTGITQSPGAAVGPCPALGRTELGENRENPVGFLVMGVPSSHIPEQGHPTVPEPRPQARTSHSPGVTSPTKDTPLGLPGGAAPRWTGPALLPDPPPGPPRFQKLLQKDERTQVDSGSSSLILEYPPGCPGVSSQVFRSPLSPSEPELARTRIPQVPPDAKTLPVGFTKHQGAH